MDSTSERISVPVHIEQGSALDGFQTNASGLSGDIDGAHGVLTTYTLFEATVSGGVAIGQKISEMVPPPSPGAYDLYLWEREFAQPLAEPVLLNGKDESQAATHDRWSFLSGAVVDQYASDKPEPFFAMVAPLLTSKEIDAYFAFNGSTPTVQGNVGVLIRTSGGDVSKHGLYLRLDVAGHSITPGSQISTYFVSDDPSKMGLSTLEGIVESVYDDHAIILLAGVLPRGDSLVILGSQQASSVGPIEVLATQPIFVSTQGSPPPPDEGGTTPACQDCNPLDAVNQTPSLVCDWDSQVIAGNPSCPPGVPLGNIVTVYTPSKSTTYCWTSAAPVGPILKEGKHVGKSTTTRTTISVEASNGDFSVSGSTEQSVTGEIDYETETTVQAAAPGPGDNNCGQCHAWVKIDADLTRYGAHRERTLLSYLLWGPEPPTGNTMLCKSIVYKARCVYDGAPTSAYCSRF